MNPKSARFGAPHIKTSTEARRAFELAEGACRAWGRRTKRRYDIARNRINALDRVKFDWHEASPVLGPGNQSSKVRTIRVRRAVDNSGNLYTLVEDTPTRCGVGTLVMTRYIVVSGLATMSVFKTETTPLAVSLPSGAVNLLAEEFIA